jgi:malonyl-CoA decarboxylase
MNTSFFGELMQTISERGRALIDRTRDRRDAAEARSRSLVELCEELLSGRGEASGAARAAHILERYEALTTGPRIAFFEALAKEFGADQSRVTAAVAAWQKNPCDKTAAELHNAAEPRRLELFRRLNFAPGGTAALVAMREQLMDALVHREDLQPVDADFVHLFTSWFNRGFLVPRRIDWSTPAIILEKIIRYEAVHQIRDWADLRRRIDPRDRRCYAFFHPTLIDEPLIFVEVALMEGIASSIAPILAENREPLPPNEATTAVFYSISNCQRGLAGVSFGHFLIKQVVEEVSRELPKLKTFVTLSPVPGFTRWLDRERVDEHSTALPAEDRSKLAALDQKDWPLDGQIAESLREPLLHAAAAYFLTGRTKKGAPIDPVARFHLGNGARLEQINWLADTSPKGLSQSYGLMVNYRYELDHIEQNHEAYAENRTVVVSPAVKRLARNSGLQLVSSAS